ncbi:hypothetical protein [Gloeothece verrucosa]|uniref:PEP-CTERM protein-sorting domain-containing protein n=1 Tax=Gloeothece verrucosa (strain PCC 7822) TaxID=497965 RepID=E0UL56_GLOV7|nr:hypothetical protein [Gloeothece verrucosa]ADN17686.1 hypothetical protein Cyan7822_5832 [Gloeothece verrucosa PCC 7822]
MLKKVYQTGMATILLGASLVLAKANTAQAVTFVDNTFNQASPVGGLGLCANFFSNCTPSGSAIGTTDLPEFTVVNDSPYIINGFLVKILTPDTEWRTVTSDIFPNINISSDKKELRFSGATIGFGEAWKALTVPNDGKVVALEISFTAVPEPKTILGSIAFGSFLVVSTLLKAKKNKTNNS